MSSRPSPQTVRFELLYSLHQRVGNSNVGDDAVIGEGVIFRTSRGGLISSSSLSYDGDRRIRLGPMGSGLTMGSTFRGGINCDGSVCNKCRSAECSR